MRPGGIDREELGRFTGNDPATALRCALDVGLLRRNGARRGKVAFAVEGDLPDGREDCRVEIDGGGLAGLRLAEVLRAKLGVSRSGLARLVEAGDVSADDGADVLAAKLRPHQAIILRHGGADGPPQGYGGRGWGSTSPPPPIFSPSPDSRLPLSEASAAGAPCAEAPRVIAYLYPLPSMPRPVPHCILRSGVPPLRRLCAGNDSPFENPLAAEIEPAEGRRARGSLTL